MELGSDILVKSAGEHLLHRRLIPLAPVSQAFETHPCPPILISTKFEEVEKNVSGK
jgi:hypothetical protein